MAKHIWKSVKSIVTEKEIIGAHFRIYVCDVCILYMLSKEILTEILVTPRYPHHAKRERISFIIFLVDGLGGMFQGHVGVF